MSLSRAAGCLSCQGDAGLGRLLPHLAPVIVEDAVLAGGRVCIRARARAGGAACRRCGVSSCRVHDRYEQLLSDAPVGGWPAVIRLSVRRFRCVNPACPAVTFAEQVAGLTSRRARRTPAMHLGTLFPIMYLTPQPQMLVFPGVLNGFGHGDSFRSPLFRRNSCPEVV